MTFNVLIADDEFFIRQRLIKLIPWQKLNFNLAYEAENGMQVLDFLKQTPVHLVILDIQMPKMNGLEVIQYIDTHYPQTKVLILSGYNDFEYARQTLRYNAVDYLLKPVDPTHLEAVLITCKNKLEKDFQNQKALQHFTHYENQTFLCEVLQGMRTVDSLKQNFPVLKTTQISCYMSCYFAEFGLQTIIQLTDYLKSANLFCEYVKESENIYIVQVFFNTRDAYLTLVPSLQNFLSSIKTYHFIFIGESFAPEVSWKPYYKSNLKNIGMRYFYPGQSVLLASQLPEMKKSSHKLLSKIRLKITSFINTKNQEGLITYLESCFLQIKEQMSFHHLQIVIYEILLTYQIYYPDFLEIDSNIYQYTEDLLEEFYLLEDLQTTLVSHGIACLSGFNALPSDLIVSQKIIQYIQDHYKEADLSVSKIARAFGFNTSYLGTLFKKTTNQSILHYISSLRLEASKELLLSQQHKVSEIAELVGYSDVFYYSKRFKKAYGCSPKEYVMTLRE